MKQGFTLLEVLVAVVIMGLTITVFFQLLTGSLRLERQVQTKLGLEVTAREAFNKLLASDPREDEFPWEGTAHGKPYEIHLFPVELQPDKGMVDEQEITITLPQELFLFEFKLFENEERTKFFRLVRYEAYKPGYFTETFLKRHLEIVPEINAE